MAELEAREKQKLEDLIELLGSIKGRHTELVTVLIPAGANVNLVTRQLEGEKSTASNIKSAATRKNVIAALEMIIRELKGMKQAPPNGLAIYCGNVSEREGGQDIQLWVYEPPKSLNVKIYRCDQEFVIEPLKEMASVQELYGLLVIDRQQAMIGLLEGSQIKRLQKLTSGVPGKVRAGGQCLSPDTLIMKDNGEIKLSDIKEGDLIEGIEFNSLKKTFNKCIKKWLVNKRECLLIITNGEYPSSQIDCSLDHIFYVHTENKITERAASDLKVGDFLITRGGKLIRILSIDKAVNKGNLIDIEVENKNFLANGLLVHNSSQRFHRITEGLAKEFFRRVAEEMKKIFFEMPKLKGILVGGPIPTKEDFLDEGQLVTKLKEKIISIKDLGYVDEHGLELLVEASQNEIQEQELVKEKKLVERFFETLGKDRKMAAYGEKEVLTALERGAVEVLLLSKKWDRDKEKEFEKKAENIGSAVFVIGFDHTDGEQFWNLTKGVGAILRFAIE
ncbi:MAG: hypothetical protein KJ600_00260 [Nanoarchaeota archaeon]|nr:hypothetical protein [Nanoarchaeota archaeon]MBU1102978.1 hypothetical protein [Nanoarchaeota archaeon]